MIHFAWPWMLLCLPLPWLCMRMLSPVRPGGAALFLPFASALAVDDALTAPTRPRWRNLLLLALWLMLVAAAIRPQWLGDPQPLPTNGRRLLLAVDASGSMATQDMADGYSRLQVVKAVAGDFIRHRGGDQVGLILFGTRPYVQAPLTADLDTVEQFLKESTVGIAGTETAIGDAIGLAIKRLRDEPINADAAAGAKADTVLILLTDGQNDAGAMPPLQAAKLAHDAGLRIYTIGVGAPPQSDLFGMGGGDNDLDEATLKSIAETTGGEYFRATDARSLQQVYQRINQLEPSAGREQWYRPRTEWFLLAARLRAAAERAGGAGAGTQVDLSTISASLHAMHFLRPLWLLALLPLWALAIGQSRRRGTQGDWSQLIDAELLTELRLQGGDAAASASPWPWLLLAWTLAVVALAGPSWRQDVATGYRAGAAWVVVLDLSPSMAARDVAPNRATRARYAIDDLLGAARDASVGLVAFSNEAYTVSPLTKDVNNIRALLPPLAPDIMPTPGDQLADALNRAGALLKKAAGKDRRVIVMTDGFADPAASFQAAENLRAQGIAVDVVGIGTEGGAPVAGASGQFARDAGGLAKLARLDTERLNHLARAGGGNYAGLETLPGLIRGLQTHREEAADTSTQGVHVERWQDGGIWLLPGLLLLAAALSRRGWL